jgi:hypothetical protein
VTLVLETPSPSHTLTLEIVYVYSKQHKEFGRVKETQKRIGNKNGLNFLTVYFCFLSFLCSIYFYEATAFHTCARGVGSPPPSDFGFPFCLENSVPRLILLLTRSVHNSRNTETGSKSRVVRFPHTHISLYISHIYSLEFAAGNNRWGRTWRHSRRREIETHGADFEMVR